MEKKHKIDACMFVSGLIFILPAWCFFSIQNNYSAHLGYFMLGIATLIIIKSLNIHNISIGSSGVALSLLKETREVQRDFKTMLHIMLPLIARSGLSDNAANLLPNRGRMYIYNLIQQIYNDCSLTDSEKNELTEELKWVLLIFIFERMTDELYKLEIGRNDRFLDIIKTIKTFLKNILDRNEHKHHWLVTEITTLYDVNITKDLGVRENEYRQIIHDYKKIMEIFISTCIIEQNLLVTGQRKK